MESGMEWNGMEWGMTGMKWNDGTPVEWSKLAMESTKFITAFSKKNKKKSWNFVHLGETQVCYTSITEQLV